MFHADPLKCRDCGGPLQIVAYITDQLAINKTLEHLGLSPPEEPRPPPEVRYVPINDEGRELPEMVADERTPRARRRLDVDRGPGVVCLPCGPEPARQAARRS